MRFIQILSFCLLPSLIMSAPLPFDPDKITIEGDLGSFRSTLSHKQVEPGLWITTIDLASDTAATPPKFELKWQVPSVDVHGFWTPNNTIDKVTYYSASVTSRAATRAPVVALYSLADENRLTFAASDALRTLKLGTSLIEEDGEFHCWVDFFSEREPDTKSYRVQLRFDLRPVPYHQALKDVTTWWEQQDGYTPAPVPDAARRPMYSTWYAFHQTLDAELLVAECERAKPLGFDAIIIDDGWQTLDDQRGYAFTGDWKPERLTDMRGLSDRIHGLGMKVLLWYSLPFVGEKAQIHPRFNGKYLRHWESQKTDVLDPRYPECRQFLIETYKTAVTEWDLDGLKLDFIDFFAATSTTELTAEDGRDHASVNEAVDRLMSDILAELRAVRPDIMIEFRQAYIGPLMRKYGNMFRAADCPNMAATNRSRTIDLRLLSGNTAVHSDMYMWHPDDTVENAAQQLLNVLFAVPQLSVRLDTISDEHRKMAAFWTTYWIQNRAILLDGVLEPRKPHANYPVVLAHGKNKTIAALYSENYLDLGAVTKRSIDIVNATGGDQIVLNLPAFEKATITIRDTMGNEVSTESKPIAAGLHQFTVPPSGLMRIGK